MTGFRRTQDCAFAVPDFAVAEHQQLVTNAHGFLSTTTARLTFPDHCLRIPCLHAAVGRTHNVVTPIQVRAAQFIRARKFFGQMRTLASGRSNEKLKCMPVRSIACVVKILKPSPDHNGTIAAGYFKQRTKTLPNVRSTIRPNVNVHLCALRLQICCKTDGHNSSGDKDREACPAAKVGTTRCLILVHSRTDVSRSRTPFFRLQSCWISSGLRLRLNTARSSMCPTYAAPNTSST